MCGKIEEEKAYGVLTSTFTHNNYPMEVVALLNCARSPGLRRIKAFTPGLKLCSSLPV